MKRKVHTESELVKAVRELEGIIERFNGSSRRAEHDAYIFRTLYDEGELTEPWMTDYNECCPHESLDNMAPTEYREIKKVG